MVSAIGADSAPTAALPVTETQRILADATAQGLVRFDAAGQIEPGLAERWIVIDGGLRYIFRLRDSQWSDGSPISTAQVVTILRRRLRDPGNSLAPYLTAIDEVVEMTPKVIEVRLRRPRPDLLKLFAQPELSLPRQRPLGGGGPFRIARAAPLLLRPAPDLSRATDEVEAGSPPERDVRLIGERTARAVARFANRGSDLVLGGTFADWPIPVVAQVAANNLRTDPAAGLFGLAVTRRTGLLASAEGRAAVAAAIDRDAIAASFGPGLPATETILPEQLDSASRPAQPAWVTLGNRERIAAARQVVIGAGLHLSLAIGLPEGPGSAILFRRLRFALGRVGIATRRVAVSDPAADLRLVDRVAPYDSARWYLRTACTPCSGEAVAAIEDARIAPTLAARGQALARADAALAADVAFIPLARPLRWSLVSPRLRQFQGNPRAWHPLNHLRNEPD